MSNKQKNPKELKMRDPFEGVPYGVHALIRNEGSTIEQVRLTDIDLEDSLFRLRPSAHQDLLLESLQHVGQQTPVVLRLNESTQKWQIVSGFRRIEATRQLKRHGILARLFDQMTDEEAIHAAVMDNFFSADLNGDILDAFMERLRNNGMLQAPILEFLDWAREKIERVTRTTEAAPARATHEDSGETGLPEQIDKTFLHLSEASQGLERIFLSWSDISPSDRKLLAAECKYIHDIYPFLMR